MVGVEVKHPIGRAHGHPSIALRAGPAPTKGVVLGHASHRDLGLGPAPDVAHGVSGMDAEGVDVVELTHVL
jgi:hypothetical protein